MMGERLKNPNRYAAYAISAGAVAVAAGCGIVEGSVASLDRPPARTAPAAPDAGNPPDCRRLPTIVASAAPSGTEYKVIGGTKCETPLYESLASRRPAGTVDAASRFQMQCLESAGVLRIMITSGDQSDMEAGVVPVNNATFNIIQPPGLCR